VTDQYCTRYMMGTRGKGDIDTGDNNVGFRCVVSPSNETLQPNHVILKPQSTQHGLEK